jgi:predicted DsbA family dithiol-disulfide isomerase
LQRFGVDGTPSFFINGRLVVGAQPLAELEGIIDEELARAKDSGFPRHRVYEQLVLDQGE